MLNNGEMAAWIDGQLYMHIREFNWRTTNELKLKRISLGAYIHNNPKDNVVWFDDVVLSTGYIGTMDQPAEADPPNTDGSGGGTSGGGGGGCFLSAIGGQNGSNYFH